MRPPLPGGYKALHVGLLGPVLKVELSLPEAGNPVTDDVLSELLAVLDALRERPEIRVLILSGAGGDFSLGGDRNAYSRSFAEDPTGTMLRVSMDLAHRVCQALSTTTAVTIARLQGHVIGAGVVLALFCDLRVGADTCRFRLPELALGLPAAWGGALPRLLSEGGTAAVRELILTGASFDAAKAERMSVLHRVVPEHELDDVVDAWVRPLIRRPAAALRATKSLFNAYAATHRLADLTQLDAEVMAAVVASTRYGRGL